VCVCVYIYIYILYTYIIIVDLYGYTLSKRVYALCSGKAAVLSETIAAVAFGIRLFDRRVFIHTKPTKVYTSSYLYYLLYTIIYIHTYNGYQSIDFESTSAENLS